MPITVVGLGPGDGRFLTREAWQVLSTAQMVYLRTNRHPAVADLPETVQRVSFDQVYETAESFEAVYSRIVTTLLDLGKTSEVIYAVPGHPFIAESTVTQLVKTAELQNIPVRIIAGLSFVEPTLAAIRQDGLDGLQLFDAIDLTTLAYPPINPDAPLLLGQVYNRLIAGEVKAVLTAVYPDEHPVYLVHAAGTNEEQVEHIPLYAIDRSDQIGHLTSLYIPALAYKSSLPSLAETVAILRSPDGCPWDQEQTSQSLRGDFLEEVGEALEAIDIDDAAGLCEELGDVLYHLLMQTQIAAENGDFTLTDVIAGIDAKLKRRHPHVWGDWQVADSAEVVRNWELLKKEEKAQSPTSLLDNTPHALPALARSQKIQSKVHKVGFDWPDISGVYDKLQEEVMELKTAESTADRQAELGDLLFVAVNLGRWLGVDAETALREANLRFSRRFAHVEQLAQQRGLVLANMDINSLELLWQEAKKL